VGSERDQQTDSQPASSGWSEEPIDVSPLRQSEGRAQLALNNVRYGDIDIASGTATITLSKGELTLILRQLRAAGGDINFALTVDGSQQAPGISYQVQLTGVQARPVLKTLADSDRLSGNMAFQTNGQSRGLTQKQLVSALNGQGSFTFTNGAIHGIDVASTLRQAQTLGFGATSGEQKTDFAELAGSFTITNGVLANKDLRMLAPLLRISGSGVVPMPPRTIDYRVEAKLVGSLEGQGGQEALAGLPIPIAVTGSWDDPSFGVDWGTVLSAAAADPARLANLPGEFLGLGEGLGIDLSLPGTGTEEAGGGLGGILQAIPGLSGGSQQTDPSASATTGETSPLGGILQAIPGLSGGGQQEQQAPPPAPSTTQTTEPQESGGFLQQLLQPQSQTTTEPAQQQPQQPPPQQPPAILEGIKNLFGD
jgi:hypothetical protein